MYRNILEQLKAWKNDRHRKPLVLMGARQVGKTYILKHFGDTAYDNLVYLNFENTPSLRALFDDNLAPNTLLAAIALELKVEIKPEKTLIVFDEVQECPAALNSLKYFNENANEYHIASAGSLLGVKLSHTKGFPVGKVNFLTLYPLSFYEFLDAIDETALKEFLLEIKVLEPIPANLHEKLTKLFKEYLYIGGMPAVINAYLDNAKDLKFIHEFHNEILNAYQLDFAKHAPAQQVMKINQVWNVVPSQLAKENKKFVYSVIRKGARASEFESAIQWLKEAGMILKVFDITTPKLPLTAYTQFEFFKIYLLDVGLLGAISNLPAQVILHGNDIFQEFKGAIIENYVAQELIRNHYYLCYWTSPGKAEIDYILQHEDKIYPLEVKSGNSSRKQSLRIYDTKYNPSNLIRTSPMNLKRNDKLINIPLYLMSDLKHFLDLI